MRYSVYNIQGVLSDVKEKRNDAEMSETMLWIGAAYLLLGGVAGFFAGLLGIGAGLLMVPALDELFLAQGMSADLSLRLALGTSMAGIIFNSLASLRAHHRHGAVLWPAVVAISPGIVIGTLAGSQIVRLMPTQTLGIVFAVFLVAVAVQMVLNLKPQPSRQLPGVAGMTATGGAIGLVMSLIAGGGGVLSVPFLIWCNVDVRKAIGTSAAIGFPIAVSGTLGYVMAGFAGSGLPAGSVGFVYLPALCVVVLASSLTARFGADLAHRLPVALLRKIFAALLLVVAARLLLRIAGH
mgnify:CR=1 FL=1